ncbi:TVP38/TMEM64 family protein [Corynebacterium kozikiae]|uniref:TVP38/TMEM64 family protein n=1 Tax=Corynebacterium kozikiae TaxID=2968469 RepID=UPI00211CF06D|nr:TVP38/TMEM64 family protein [Corynebacterium sp. 76QC2CO]
MNSFLEFLRGVFRDGFNTVAAWPTWKKLAVSAAGTAFVAITLLADIPSLHTLQQWSMQQGSWFVFSFFALYVAITQFPIPRTVLTLSSGVLFGPALGVGVALAATTVSALISLLIVRRLLGNWMRPRLAHPAVRGVSHRLHKRGWASITALRMIAAVPFSILNYVAALSPVPALGFTVATLVGSAPGTVVTVLLGNSLATGADTQIVLATLGLAALGVLGLILDTRIPVKP